MENFTQNSARYIHILRLLCYNKYIWVSLCLPKWRNLLLILTLSWHCLINICSKCYQIFQKTFSPAKAHQQWEIARWSNNHYITLLTVNNFENNNLVPFINSLQGQHEIGRIMCNNLCTLLEKMFHSIHPIHFQKMLSYAHYWCSPQLTIL